VEFLQHKLEKDNYNKAIIQNLNHYFDLWKQKISFYKIFDKLTILNNHFDNEVFQNITSLVLRIENVAGKELDKITGTLNLTIFEEEEKNLFNSLDNFSIEIDNIDELLTKIKNTKIIENATLFFDKILVNDKNLEKRNNRLLLLKFVKDKIKIL
jgi:glycyl-tRNA synthetase beta subunit